MIAEEDARLLAAAIDALGGRKRGVVAALCRETGFSRPTVHGWLSGDRTLSDVAKASLRLVVKAHANDLPARP